MAQKIKKGGSINKRYKIIHLQNRYFIVDSVNPYKPMNYIALFTSFVRTSYPAWEIAKEDLTSLQYQNSDTYLPSLVFFEGAFDYNYEEGLLDERTSSEETSAKSKWGAAIGFALVPTISAIPGLNLPDIARWIFLAIAIIGMILFPLYKQLTTPRLKTEHYKPVILAIAGRYGKKMTWLRLLGRSLAFLIAIAIHIGLIYAWITIPLRDLNIIYYFFVSLFLWGAFFGYFGYDPRSTEPAKEEGKEDEMVKYVVISEPKSLEELNERRLKPYIYPIIWVISTLVVNWAITGTIPFQEYLYGLRALILSSVIALVTVAVVSRNHDGYNEKTYLIKN